MDNGPNLITVWNRIPGSGPLRKASKGDYVGQAFWRNEKNGWSVRIHPHAGKDGKGQFKDFGGSGDRGGKLSLVACHLYGPGASQSTTAVSEASKWLKQEFPGFEFDKVKHQHFSDKEKANARAWFTGARLEIEKSLEKAKAQIEHLPELEGPEADKLQTIIMEREKFRTRLNGIYLSTVESGGWNQHTTEKVVYEYRDAKKRDEQRGDKEHSFVRHCISVGRDYRKSSESIVTAAITVELIEQEREDRAGKEPEFPEIPGVKLDPAEFINRYGAESFKKLIDRATPVDHWLVKKAAAVVRKDLAEKLGHDKAPQAQGMTR